MKIQFHTGVLRQQIEECELHFWNLVSNPLKNKYEKQNISLLKWWFRRFITSLIAITHKKPFFVFFPFRILSHLHSLQWRHAIFVWERQLWWQLQEKEVLFIWLHKYICRYDNFSSCDIFNPVGWKGNKKKPSGCTCTYVLAQTRLPYKSPSSEERVRTQFQQKDFNWS